MLNPIHQITVEISSPNLAFFMAHELMCRYEMLWALVKSGSTPLLRARFFNEAIETRVAYFVCKNAAVAAMPREDDICSDCGEKQDVGGVVPWCNCIAF